MAGRRVDSSVSRYVCVCVCVRVCVFGMVCVCAWVGVGTAGELTRSHKETFERDLELLEGAMHDDQHSSKLLLPHARQAST